MDFGYDDHITRYDSSESEDEATYTAPAPATHKIVVRLSPRFAARRSGTVVISLVPLSSGLAETGDGYTQMGVIYAPVVAQPKGKQCYYPVGDASCVQTNNALARIVQGGNGQVYVVASGATPPEVQHAWIRAVARNLSPDRIVLVDALETGASLARFRSPAVLASAMVVGLAAAILNYADTHNVPCRHVRTDRGVAPRLDAADIDALFASTSHSVRQSEETSILADTADRRETSASLYV